MKSLKLGNLPQNSLFLPTMRSRQFEFPAAQYYMFSKQSVKNNFKTSVFIHNVEKNIKFEPRVEQNEEKKF